MFVCLEEPDMPEKFRFSLCTAEEIGDEELKSWVMVSFSMYYIGGVQGSAVSVDACRCVTWLFGDFSLDIVMEECRSMHWWTHNGCGRGWIGHLVRRVSWTTN